MKQAQSLRDQLRTQLGHAGDVVTRPVEACYEAKLYWITGRLEHDRNRSPCSFNCDGRGRTGCRDHSYLSVHDISRYAWKSVEVTLGPIVFDSDILAVHVASFAQTSAKCRLKERVRV